MTQMIDLSPSEIDLVDGGAKTLREHMQDAGEATAEALEDFAEWVGSFF